MTHIDKSPAAENIIEIVRQMLPEFRKSERKVADHVLLDPRKILNATLMEVSTLADVSQPTVMRFCVAVGCTGFHEFKLRLAHSLALGTLPTHSVLDSTDSPESLIEKIFGYTMTSLDWARTHLDKSAIARATALIESARSLEFFGHGASSIVAQDAQQKFPLFGIPCGAQVDSHQQIMMASIMGPGDVAIIFSNTGRTKSLIDIAEIARKNGAKVVGVSGSQSPLLDSCDVGILVETLDNTDIYTPTISRIAFLVIIDVLSTVVALHRNVEHGQKFEQMKQRLGSMRLDEQN
jgi:RpiR family transcriptional regulator, carbohydrate utilization regulator